MSRYLLDTSAYSVFLRGHAQVVARVATAAEICLNAVVLGELRAGFLAGGRSARNQRILREFLDSPVVRTLVLDEETADRYAAIVRTLRKLGRPLPTNDIWIAASALQHGLRLLTCDAHFKWIPLLSVECFA